MRLAYALKRRTQSDSQRQVLELKGLNTRCRRSRQVVTKLESERRPGVDEPVEYVECCPAQIDVSNQGLSVFMYCYSADGLRVPQAVPVVEQVGGSSAQGVAQLG